MTSYYKHFLLCFLNGRKVLDILRTYFKVLSRLGTGTRSKKKKKKRFFKKMARKNTQSSETKRNTKLEKRESLGSRLCLTPAMVSTKAFPKAKNSA